MSWQPEPGFVEDLLVRIIGGFMAAFLGVFVFSWVADIVGFLRDDLYAEALVATLILLFLLGFLFGERFLKLMLAWVSLFRRRRWASETI